MSMLSFTELVTGASSRVCDINGIMYTSVRDLIMIICSKDSNQANEVWRRLDVDTKDGLSDELAMFKFPGESASKVITLRGAIELIQVLPGNMAKEFRKKGGVARNHFSSSTRMVSSTWGQNSLTSEMILENIIKV